MKKRSFLVFALYLIASVLYSSAQKLPDNWFSLDPLKDNFMGMSANKAYETILKGKKSTTVIVAVIDAGVDINHPDLKEHIWTNPNELIDNGIDDDKNGYIDDIHGWDYIGGKTGNVQYDNIEATRIYRKYKDIFENPATANNYKEYYKLYIQAKEIYEKEHADAKKNYESFKRIKDWMDKMKTDIGKDSIIAADLKNYKVEDPLFQIINDNLIRAILEGENFNDLKKEIDETFNYYNSSYNYHYNIYYDNRQIVGDNYEDASEKNYGNNQVKGPHSDHGTHVAGIIGALRKNGTGIDGLADNVMIMVLRVVPDGDERDKDVANAIRYAAENGAKIINMSFGKSLPYNKKVVDDAVKFALAKDVLIIHASGNDGINLDKNKNNYPKPEYENSKENARAAWIEVGAVASNGTAASFSNYGHKSVDVFAPGVKIYSTMPEEKYDYNDGTSMAAPMVAGAAALIRSYYPNLNARQVKEALVKSVLVINSKVPKPGKPKQKIKFKKLCSSGGVINVYNALEVAGGMSSK
jgi:cell wall-associated protease